MHKIKSLNVENKHSTQQVDPQDASDVSDSSAWIEPDDAAAMETAGWNL